MNGKWVLGIGVAVCLVLRSALGATGAAITPKTDRGPISQSKEAVVPGAAFGKAKKILDVSLKEENGSARFTIVGDGVLGTYQTLKLTAPTRLVLDVKGVDSALPRSPIKGGSRLVKELRVGRHPDKVRFVFYLEGKGVPPYQIEAKENRLIVSFAGIFNKSNGAEVVSHSSPPRAGEKEKHPEGKTVGSGKEAIGASGVTQTVSAPSVPSKVPERTLEDKEPETPLMVDQLVEEALRSNPEIQAARKKWEVYKEKIPQAYALPDPMLGLGITNLPTNFSFRKEDMTMKEISISQMFPFPGKRPLMKEMAEKEAEAVYTEIQTKTLQVIKEVKTAYYDLSHVYRAREVIQRTKEILEGFARIAETRYSVGEGIQQDVIKSHVEVSKMVDELLMQEQKKRALEAKLNALLNRPPETVIAKPAEVVFRKLAFSLAELQQMALDANPVLKGMRKMIEAKEKARDLAKREYYPDFTFKFAYGQRDNGPEMRRRDMLTGMVEMNIPIFYKSKQDRKVAETQAEIQSADAQFRAMKNEVLFMVADMVSMIRKLEKQVDLYKTGIIPQAGLQVASAMSAYRVNKADFMTLLDSQMTLYRYELEYHQALTDYEKNLANLETVLGKELFPKGEGK